MSKLSSDQIALINEGVKGQMSFAQFKVLASERGIKVSRNAYGARFHKNNPKKPVSVSKLMESRTSKIEKMKAQIAEGINKGQSYKEIHKATGIPFSVVGYHGTRIRKAMGKSSSVVHKSGGAPVIKKEKTLGESFYYGVASAAISEEMDRVRGLLVHHFASKLKLNPDRLQRESHAWAQNTKSLQELLLLNK
jgi:hypothetical protein